jgi:hypothetical protein
MKVVSVRVTHCWSKSRVAKKISQPVLNKSGACTTLLHCTVHINVCDPDGLGKGCNLAVDSNGDPTDLDFHLPAFLALRGPYAVSVAWFASARAPLLVLVQLLFGLPDLLVALCMNTHGDIASVRYGCTVCLDVRCSVTHAHIISIQHNAVAWLGVGRLLWLQGPRRACQERHSSSRSRDEVA